MATANQIRVGQTVDQGRYVAYRFIAEGGFGEVWAGEESSTHQKVVIKWEKSSQEETLQTEVAVYRLLQEQCPTGFARMLYSRIGESRNLIVLERLGSSLHSMMQHARAHMSVKTVAKVGIQLLYRLEVLHSIGYLHRDIKPANVLVERKCDGSYGPTVFLIDFGNAARFRSRNGKLRVWGPDNTVAGTVQFAPLAWHEGHVHCRRDDLESLLYCLVFLTWRGLPWSPHCGSDAFEQKVSIGKALVQGLPSEFRSILRYIDSLSFTDKPDYSHLRSLLRSVIIKEGGVVESSPRWPY